MAKPPKFFTEYDHQDPVIDFTGSESLARQEFRDEADINNIIKKYQVTGFLVDPSVPRSRSPLFGDFVNLPDFTRAQQILADAKQRFEALPASVREAFGNDPARLLAFLDAPPADRDAHLTDLLVKHSLIENPAKPDSAEETARSGAAEAAPASEHSPQE